MNPAEFEHLAGLVREKSGIVLSADKTYLLNSRLAPVAKQAGHATIADMVASLRKGPANPALEDQIVDAMTTNESYFFRDKKPFEIFEEVMVPDLVQLRAAMRKIRIWCAAASSGQEPYTLAIQLKEMQHKLAGWRTEIIGTDISTEILEKAKAGLYSQFEVQRGMPIQLLVKYFEKRGDMWQVNSAIRAMVQLRRFNLLDRMLGLGTFDIVFCRNVLIYFDTETKADILQRIAAQMAPDGYLVLGAAETVFGITDVFTPVPGQRGAFRRTDFLQKEQAQPSRLSA